MRCLLLADRELALREASMLHRLVIGLLDAGVHVTHAAPESVFERIEPALGVEILPYRMHGMPWTRSVRARQILEQFESATAVSSKEPGLVHAFGAGCVPIALEVAAAGDMAFVLDVNSRTMASAVTRLVGERFTGVMLAGTPSVARLLQASGIPASSVRECQWGVLPGDAKRASDGGVCIAIGGAGEDKAAWEDAIRGVAQVAASHQELVVFIDDDAATRAGIGPLVSSLGLSPIVSRVPDFEARRDLVVQSDIMIWPERLGEVRSVVLDAMASRAAVVALSDPDVPALSDPEAAILVSGDPSEWVAVIESLVGSREKRDAIGARGAEYVRSRCSASSHVGSVVDAYEWATGSLSSMQLGKH